MLSLFLTPLSSYVKEQPSYNAQIIEQTNPVLESIDDPARYGPTVNKLEPRTSTEEDPTDPPISLKRTDYTLVATSLYGLQLRRGISAFWF